VLVQPGLQGGRRLTGRILPPGSQIVAAAIPVKRKKMILVKHLQLSGITDNFINNFMVSNIS